MICEGNRNFPLKPLGDFLVEVTDLEVADL